MQNEDFGKAFILKELFKGEAVHTEPLLASLKVVFNTIFQNGGLGRHLVRVDDNDSTVILNVHY
jgi:hypothetical protein